MPGWVNRLCWPFRSARAVEVGQDVVGSSFQGAAELTDLFQQCPYSVGDVGDELGRERLGGGSVGVPVGGDHPLADAPGRFDLDVGRVGEQA